MKQLYGRFVWAGIEKEWHEGSKLDAFMTACLWPLVIFNAFIKVIHFLFT